MRCDQCKFSKPVACGDVLFDYLQCTNFDHFDDDSAAGSFNGSRPSPGRALALDGDSAVAWVYVSPTFGCICFIPQE